MIAEKKIAFHNILFVECLLLVCMLNVIVSSIYPILIMLAVSLLWILTYGKITLEPVTVFWIFAILYIALRTPSWYNTSIKIFLAFVIGLSFYIVNRRQYSFFQKINNKLVLSVFVFFLLTVLVQYFMGASDEATGILGQTYYVHICVFLLCSFLIFRGERIKLPAKIFFLFLCAIVIFLTGSRSNLITIPFSLLVVYLISSSNRKLVKRIFLTAFIGAAALGIFYFMLEHFELASLVRIKETIDRYQAGLDFSNGRTGLKQRAWEAYRGSNPLIGIGWLNYASLPGNELHSNVHNFYLQVLCEAGIIGVFLIFTPMLISLVSSVSHLRRLKPGKEKQEMMICVAVQIYFLVSSYFHATSYDFCYIWIYFCFMTYGYAVWFHAEKTGMTYDKKN